MQCHTNVSIGKSQMALPKCLLSFLMAGFSTYLITKICAEEHLNLKNPTLRFVETLTIRFLYIYSCWQLYTSRILQHIITQQGLVFCQSMEQPPTRTMSFSYQNLEQPPTKNPRVSHPTSFLPKLGCATPSPQFLHGGLTRYPSNPEANHEPDPVNLSANERDVIHETGRSLNYSEAPSQPNVTVEPP